MSPKVIRKVTVRVRIRRPVHIELAKVASQEEPGKWHTIALDRHNMVFCTCRGWRYNGHTCPHLSEFRKRLAAEAEARRDEKS